MPSPGQTPLFGPRRLFLCVAVLCVIPVGLAARFLLRGGLADITGGALYTVMIYLLVGFIKPVWSPARLAIVALAISCLVELLQLTPLPGALSAVVPPLRLVLGTTFSVTDLPAYALGATLAAAADRWGLWHSRAALPVRSAGHGQGPWILGKAFGTGRLPTGCRFDLVDQAVADWK